MLDEFYIEELVKKKFPSKSISFPAGIGDDAAVVRVNSKKIVASCDSQVEDVHFNLKLMSPEEVAFRSVSVSASDLSAMGAKPKFFLNSLFLPRKTSKSFVDNLFKGFKKACDFYDIKLIGGNVSQSKSLILDISIFGEVVNNNIKERLKSSVGDLIYVSGKIGDASLGLEVLKKRNSPNSKEKRMIAKYKSPKAKVDLGLFLGQLSYVTSMIDITDGLSLDLVRLIGKKSRKGANIIWENIPKSDYTFDSTNSKKLMNNVLYGGDDYELLFTLKQSKAKIFEALCKKRKFQVYKIGMVNATGKFSINKGGKTLKLRPIGFVHKF